MLMDQPAGETPPADRDCEMPRGAKRCRAEADLSGDSARPEPGHAWIPGRSFCDPGAELESFPSEPGSNSALEEGSFVSAGSSREEG